MNDRRTGNRTPSSYTMKTSTIQTPTTAPYLYTSPHTNSVPFSHTHTNTQSHGSSPTSRAMKGSRTGSPLASPRLPYSAGQAYPPKLSPGKTRASTKRSASPSYFGLVVEDSTDPRDSSLLPGNNWSPQSSSVKPFAAAVPKQVPLDPNPEFEAFKKQVDAYRDRGLSSLSTTTFTPRGGTSLTTTFIRPKAPRSQTHASDSTTSSETQSSRTGSMSTHSGPHDGTRMETDHDSLHDSAYISGDSKRNSEACMPAPPFPNLKLPGFGGTERSRGQDGQKAMPTTAEDRGRRVSAPGPRTEHNPGAQGNGPHLAPSKSDTSVNGGPGTMLPEQLQQLIEDPAARMLLIDVRSAQSYARSRIRTALNLCIPTTLLKRATFNLQKLQQTFQKPEDRGAFANWKDTDYLVVYDASSAEKTEATTAMNMIKKFTNEGYTGETYVLRGGFNVFAEEYPDLIYHQAADNPVSNNVSAGPGGLAPVIGGVLLPSTSGAPNPFFGNIRQNMDLADGVGQMDIMKPKGLVQSNLPQWLRSAAEDSNHGKQVSDKFLRIELDEQTRMKEAYSLLKCATSPKGGSVVQLSGIEQGDRNRYKDILPFEHSRVKLRTGDTRSDYFNASHIKASRSNKRYLATQGPLPATFDDFWSVIWDQDVRVIVMLTAQSEGGQLKCHAYWNNREYGPMRLRLLSEKKVSLDIDQSHPESPAESGRRRAHTTATGQAASPMPRPQSEAPYVIIRKFALSHTSHPFAPMREITHLHYPSWPDFGVPAQPSHLLALVELANVMQRASLPVETAAITSPRRASSNFAPGSPLASPGAPTTPGTVPWADEPEMSSRSRPMLVHCSAGCGRTGTFCTVDSVIDMLKRQRMHRMAKHMPRDEDAVMEDALDVVSEGSTAASRRPSNEGASSRRSSNDGPPSNRRPSALSRRRSSGGPQAEIDTSWVASDDVDLVQGAVEDFRRQRLSMVQSLRQFVLCYETVLEWVSRVQDKGEVRKRSGSLGML